MKTLDVLIEINGKLRKVGELCGNNFENTVFRYAKEYLDSSDCRAISISLPLQEESFSYDATRNFFEGLLPEGFSRKLVAAWAKVDENDYLAVLEKLGHECLGAIQILIDEHDIIDSGYKTLTINEVKKLAAEGTVKSTEFLIETHLSLTGASGKVGLYYDERNGKWYLPYGTNASTHIVKQSHVRLRGIVVNEQFCMLAARKMGILTPESFVLNLGNGNDEEVLFVSKRYDRVLAENDNDNENENENASRPYRLHQEDFCQALGIPASKKYEASHDEYLKNAFALVRSWSSDPIEDQLRLWDMLVFNYLIGNTDCHLKNFSLIYSKDLKHIRLAPAYDIVCTLIYGGTEEMSFYIGGENNINKIDRESFLAAASEIGLGRKIAMQHYDSMAAKFMDIVNETADEMKNAGYDIDHLRVFLTDRAKYISKCQ